jgi:hypothetical protein
MLAQVHRGCCPVYLESGYLRKPEVQKGIRLASIIQQPAATAKTNCNGKDNCTESPHPLYCNVKSTCPFPRV